MTQMTQTQRNVASINSWIAKRNIAQIKPVVLQTSNGKWACMISFTEELSGAANVLHLGFAKYRATAERIALATATGYASR